MSGKVVDNLGRSSGTIKAGSSGANVTYDTTEKTSNFNAEAGVGYLVDTSGGAITATLPASPEGGDSIAFKDYKPSFGTNALTIARNGNKIQGNASNSEISTDRASVVMVYVDSTEGWVFVEESNVGDLRPPHIIASGGTETTSGDFKIHTFNSSGTFSVTNAGTSAGSTTVDYLVIAGGGGGGNTGTGGAGGGGAGGFRQSFPNPATGGLSISVQDYPITVGGGGGGGAPSAGVGSSGGNSVFSSITSAGGGGGGGGTPSGPPVKGADGGSGGGSTANAPSEPSTPAQGGSGNTPPVSPPQGNNGGNGSFTATPDAASGGGGGAGSAGSNATSGSGGVGGAGGNGTASSITGSPVTRAGGGGGGTRSPYPQGGRGGAAGPGGGGPGSQSDPVAPYCGQANTGGGGGGDSAFGNGGGGGSGVVIIRYKYQN